MGGAALWFGIEAPVRAVEEPYLMRSHGEAYADYAASVGRFLPGLGQLTTGWAERERNAS